MSGTHVEFIEFTVVADARRNLLLFNVYIVVRLLGVVEVVYDWLVIHDYEEARVGYTHASHAKRLLATAKHVERIVNCKFNVSVRYKNMLNAAHHEQTSTTFCLLVRYVLRLKKNHAEENRNQNVSVN